MAIIAIDLGTTYSVMGTPETLTGKYFENIRGVTLIKDENNQRITPSVVAVDRQGNFLVGRRAKARAGLMPGPIMFVKRAMGEATEFPLGDKQLKPEEVSAEILRYLRQVAEKQLGEPVDEAVITVPAYFSTLQKQKTKKAGELAGLHVAEILQEPVAAALTYCQADNRDPLTIMTYDLGGGTFDVAIVRREAGVFDIKAFAGDRHLGGYDFDRKLVNWMLDQLQQSYELPTDRHSDAFRLMESKLLISAETVKIRLSERDSYALMEPSSGIVDLLGEPVILDMEITRETFEGLINQQIEETINHCHEALQKAQMEPADIDEVVLVGGSSRIPLITRRLETVFGKRPQLMEPDLCVAIGAAILARRLGQRIGPLKLSFLPEVTDMASIQVAGTLEEIEDVVGYTAVLTPADGTLPQRRPLTEQGGFLFPNVPLANNSTNHFTLRLEDAQGQPVVTHTLSIRREASAAATTSTPIGLTTNVLAKPISIETADGEHIVAPEGTPLPFTAQIQAQTNDQSGQVRIPVLEDSINIGEIVVEDVPAALPVGTQVDIKLTLRTDFYIVGEATIPAENLTGKATIEIPPVVIKGLAELQSDYLSMSQRVTEALAQADPGLTFKLGPRLKAALESCRQLLYDDPDPNLAKVQEMLGEIKGMLRHLSSWQPDPPPARFEQLQAEIADQQLPQLQRLELHDAFQRYQAQLKAYGKKGEKALADKNEAVWRDANQQLVELRSSIELAIDQEQRRRHRQQTGTDGPETPPDPRVIKIKLGMDLTRLKEEAVRNGRSTSLNDDLTAAQQKLDAIDADDPQALTGLMDYYQNHHQPLQSKVSGPGAISRSDDLPGGLIKALSN